MKKTLFFSALLFSICFALQAQKYIVHRPAHKVYEIKDSLGHSIYQCFADTVILMQESQYAYLVKDKKIGIADLRNQITLIPPLYDVLVSDRSLPPFKSYKLISTTDLPGKNGTIRIYQCGDQKLVHWSSYIKDIHWTERKLEQSYLKFDEFEHKQMFFFSEVIFKETTQPYYRIDADGIRIDSVCGYDANGNGIVVYPPRTININNFLADLKGTYLYQTADHIWLENAHLYVKKDSLVHVYHQNFHQKRVYNLDKIASGDSSASSFFGPMMEDNVKLGYFYDLWEGDRRDDPVNGVFSFKMKNRCGAVHLGYFHYPPFVYEQIPAEFDVVYGNLGVAADSVISFWNVRKRQQDDPGKYVIVNYDEERIGSTERFIDMALQHQEAGFEYAGIADSGLVIFNWFASRPIRSTYQGYCRKDYVDGASCFDPRTKKYLDNCGLRNIHNRSGIFDRKTFSWVLEPQYTLIDKCSNGFIVYRFSNGDNYSFKLESGLFDGKKWIVPLKEQYLLEENGQFYQIINKKKQPYTFK